MNKIIVFFLCCGISLYGSLKEANIQLTDECSNNNFKSCLELGENGIFVHQLVNMAIEDKLIDMTNKDENKRVETLEREIIFPLQKACNAGLERACTLLSKSYHNGIGGILKDIDKTIKYANLACVYGDGEGCKLLAYSNAEKYPDLPLTDKSILGNFEKACEKNDASACSLAGKIAINADDNDNRFKAVSFVKKGCIDKNLVHNEISKRNNCTLYGVMLYYGDYVKKDTKLGLKLILEGCREGSGLACLNAAKIYENLSEGKTQAEKRKLLNEAKKYYGDACNLQEIEGCERGNQIDEILKNKTIKVR